MPPGRHSCRPSTYPNDVSIRQKNTEDFLLYLWDGPVNKGSTRSEARKGLCLSDYANLGAADTEVRYFVEVLLDKTFGEFESLRTRHIGR